MKVCCSPDIHESVRDAISENHAVSKFEVLDYDTDFSNHLDTQVLIAKKEYSRWQNLRNLELYQVATAGYDKVDVQALWSRGVAVCNNGGANANAVAELTVCSIIACLRNLTYQHNNVVNEDWKCLKHTGEEFASKTLGIIGLGKIGSKVAKLADAYGCRLIGYDINPRTRLVMNNIGGEFQELDYLLCQSDIVSLHLPLSKSNAGMVNKEFLSKFKNGSIFVNTARGELQDEIALLNSLENGKLSAVVLDVFSKEPYFNRRLFEYADPNITGRGSIFLPHTGPSKKTNSNLIEVINQNINLLAVKRANELEQVVWYE